VLVFDVHHYANHFDGSKVVHFFRTGLGLAS
jgi:hypothetical protein